MSLECDLQMEVDAAVVAVRLAARLPVSTPQRWAVRVTLAAMLVALALDGDTAPDEVALGTLADACCTSNANAARRIDVAFGGRPGYPGGSCVIALFGLDLSARLLADLAAEHGATTPVRHVIASQSPPISGCTHGADALDRWETGA